MICVVMTVVASGIESGKENAIGVARSVVHRPVRTGEAEVCMSPFYSFYGAVLPHHVSIVSVCSSVRLSHAATYRENEKAYEYQTW